jgi:hypothetical protein
MFPIVIFVAGTAVMVIGAVIANALGKLPNSEQLEAEDRARFQKLEHE